MKKLILFLCIVWVTAISLQGQTKIDEYISIEFPKEPSIKDTIIDNIHFTSYFLKNELEVFIVTKVNMASNGNGINDLPYDARSLDEFYKKIIRGQNSTMLKVNFEIKNSSKIKLRL